MSEILYKITGKLFCKTQATAFLINERTALTALHAVKDNLINGTKIKLEFYDLIQYQFIKEVEAKVIAESDEFDIAILELNEPIYNTEKWPSLNSQKVDLEDKWECVGFPISWESAKEGSRFCYLKGNIYLDSSFDKTSKYDLHLSGENINQDWDDSLEGLSGSPVLIDGEIRAIVIAEEISFVNSPIKTVSINRVVNFLENQGIKINTSFGAKTNQINTRLNLQKTKCEELFSRIEYSGQNTNINLLINSYYMRYNEDGKSLVKPLAEYLASSISDYAFTLVDIESMQKGSIKPLIITKKMNKLIAQIQSEDKLGSILIWMLIEGILGAPKGLKRISIEDETNVFNDLHIGLNTEFKLVLYMGEGKLHTSLQSAIFEAIESLKSYVNIKDDIFFVDDYIFDQIESNQLKKLLLDFKNPDTDWSDIVLELTIFTGYDSNLMNQIEKRNFPKEVVERAVAKKYLDECAENEKLICDEIAKISSFENIKINWFTLPFNTVKDFEILFFNEFFD